MNIDELRDEIAKDEGRVNSVYLDHLSLKTVGIGHLVNEWDEEYDKPVGTPVSEERVNELFAKKICANMMFNMGRPRLSGFKKFRAAISNNDWQECAIQMEDSRWHKQVTKRADRLISRMRAVEGT